MQTKISSSPQRNTFQKQKYLERMAAEGKTVDNNADVAAMVDYYNVLEQRESVLEADHEWSRNNMEHDLRTTEWILTKTRNSDVYAQNLYAAMCNNEFLKVNIEDTPESLVEVLKDGPPLWSCSWRHAGGIISDMQQSGDYIDWYCSGIRDTSQLSIEDYNKLDESQRNRYDIVSKYVSESVVTEEIRDDLLRLGWKVIDEE